MQNFFLLLLYRYDYEVSIYSPKSGTEKKIFDGELRGMAEITMDGEQCLVLAWE